MAKIDDIVKAVKDLTEQVGLAVTEIKEMKDIAKRDVNQLAIPDKVETPVEVKKEEPKEYPVPMDYRDAVDTILNPSFGIRITPSRDLPQFEFAIIVPKEYSNAPKAYWEMYHEDVRPRMINYADGLNGVTDWCGRVFNNFNPEIKAKIVADRVK